MPIAERGQGADKLSQYLIERLEADENPIYLHEVGDFLSARINSGRNSSQNLQRIYSNKVQAIFEQPADEMRPEYNEMSLYRFAQIVNAMNPTR